MRRQRVSPQIRKKEKVDMFILLILESIFKLFVREYVSYCLHMYRKHMYMQLG